MVMTGLKNSESGAWLVAPYRHAETKLIANESTIIRSFIGRWNLDLKEDGWEPDAKILKLVKLHLSDAEFQQSLAEENKHRLINLNQFHDRLAKLHLSRLNKLQMVLNEFEEFDDSPLRIHKKEIRRLANDLGKKYVLELTLTPTGPTVFVEVLTEYYYGFVGDMPASLVLSPIHTLYKGKRFNWKELQTVLLRFYADEQLYNNNS
jgi:hypothetical protein